MELVVRRQPREQKERDKSVQMKGLTFCTNTDTQQTVIYTDYITLILIADDQ